VSRFFKSAAFPILIVVVLAFFAQKLISPGDRTPEPNYSQFLTQVDEGRVKNVTLNTKNNRLDVELNNDRKYQTAYPSPPSHTSCRS
jgi:cell division protease FtsH